MNTAGALNCLLITHNNILQCFIDKLRFISGLQNDERKTRFKNCAILRLSLNLNSYDFTLELVYNGLLSEEENAKVSEERPYYVALATLIEPEDAKLYVKFEVIQGKINQKTKILNLLPTDLDNLKEKFNTDTINFYIVRHGQAKHNEKKWNMSGFGLELDTTITEEGTTQAINSANELKSILGNESIDIVCVSDLERTRQTVLPFFKILGRSISSLKMVVIPCVNELNKSGSNGDCYEKSSDSSVIGNKSARENYPACTPEKCPKVNLHEDVDIDIDWSLYSLFYDNKMRSYPKLTDKPNCKDTNMISMAVYYLLNYYDSPETSRVSLIEGETVNSLDLNDDTVHIGGSKKKRGRVSRKIKTAKKRLTKRRRKRKQYLSSK
jgi:broad specificity phosphatase PhoE